MESDTSSGFIMCTILDGKGGGKTISTEEIETALSQEGTLWLHLNYSKPDAQTWLREKSGLSTLLFDALVAEETRPRITFTDDGLFVILRVINSNPGADPDDMISLRLWIDKQRIISMRNRQGKVAFKIYDSINKGNGPTGAGDFLIRLIEQITIKISHTANDIDAGVDELEEQIFEEKLSILRSKLLEFRRKIIRLRRYILPQREVMMQLQSERVALISDEDRLRLHETSEVLTHAIEELDAARERAGIIQEELSSRLSEQMDRSIYMMSIVATIFLPLSLLTGLLGINVGGIPGAKTSWAFYFVCILLVVIAVVEFVLVKRKRIWID